VVTLARPPIHHKKTKRRRPPKPDLPPARIRPSLMSSETEPDSEIPRPPADQRGTDARDSCRQKTDFHRGVLSANRTALGTPDAPCKKASLLQWADGLGLLLNSADLPKKFIRGGKEHELFHEEETDRYLKVTRNGVFGFPAAILLSTRFFSMLPGINLARIPVSGHQCLNRTRQGYARKRILKPAGHLFSGCRMGGGRA